MGQAWQRTCVPLDVESISLHRGRSQRRPRREPARRFRRLLARLVARARR